MKRDSIRIHFIKSYPRIDEKLKFCLSLHDIDRGERYNNSITIYSQFTLIRY
jgi:hypothetical protein